MQNKLCTEQYNNMMEWKITSAFWSVHDFLNNDKVES